MRILVASPAGEAVALALSQLAPDAAVFVATEPKSLHEAIADTVRFDVVVSDLVWNNPGLEFAFDGLDVVNMLIATDRLAPVVVAAQGVSLEEEFLQEAARHPQVVGLYQKSNGVPSLLSAVREAAIGRSMLQERPDADPPPLFELFRGQRGETAGRLAGAIAAGRASDAISLARAAQVGVNTANKVASTYLGPIIRLRGEHDPDLSLTLATVYRWCGLHARYLVSWCRRHGHADVL